MFQRRALGEESGVGRIGAGPAAFDVIDAQRVERQRDLALVLDGEIDALRLRPVAQGGVEEIEAFALGSPLDLPGRAVAARPSARCPWPARSSRMRSLSAKFLRLARGVAGGDGVGDGDRRPPCVLAAILQLHIGEAQKAQPAGQRHLVGLVQARRWPAGVLRSSDSAAKKAASGRGIGQRLGHVIPAFQHLPAFLQAGTVKSIGWR